MKTFKYFAIAVSLLTILPPVYSYADAVSDDVLEAQYKSAFRRRAPTRAELGVDPFPGATLRIDTSAENMATYYSANVRGQPPRVYAVEYFTRSATYSQVVTHFSRFADSAAPPREEVSRSGTTMTTIELARDGNPKQRIVISDRTGGYGCTASSDDEAGNGQPCAYIKIVTMGEASWAALGRGQPRAVAQAPAAPANNNNSSTNNSQSNSQNPTTPPTNTTQNQTCAQQRNSQATGRALGSALGMLARGYSGGTAAAQGAATYGAEQSRSCN
jgi:hypothetical protein